MYEAGIRHLGALLPSPPTTAPPAHDAVPPKTVATAPPADVEVPPVATAPSADDEVPPTTVATAPPADDEVPPPAATSDSLSPMAKYCVIDFAIDGGSAGGSLFGGMTNLNGSTSCGECPVGGALMRSRQSAGGIFILGSCACLADSFMGGGGTPCVTGDGDVLGGGPDGGKSRSSN